MSVEAACQLALGRAAGWQLSNASARLQQQRGQAQQLVAAEQKRVAPWRIQEQPKLFATCRL